MTTDENFDPSANVVGEAGTRNNKMVPRNTKKQSNSNSSSQIGFKCS